MEIVRGAAGPGSRFLCATQYPPACPAWGDGSIGNRAPSQSVLRVRADCGGPSFTAESRHHRSLLCCIQLVYHSLGGYLSNPADYVRDRVDDFDCFRGVDFVLSLLVPFLSSWSQEPVHVGGWRSELPGRAKR